MKSIQILITPPNHKSGAVTASRNAAMALKKISEVEYWRMSDHYSRKKEDSMLIIDVPSKTKHCKLINKVVSRNYSNALILSSFPKLISKENTKIFHIHNTHPAVSLYQTAKTCKKNRKTIIFSSHGFIEMFTYKKYFSFNKFFDLAYKISVWSPFRKALDLADYFVVSSTYEKKILNSVLNDDNIFIAPNGVTLEFLFDGKYRTNKLKGIRNSFDILLLYSGNITRNKGIENAIKSLKFIEASCALIITGSPSHLDYKKELELLAKHLPKKKKVIFTDYISKKDLLGIIDLIDFQVHPTYADTFPLTVLEGMARGKVIIATNVGGIKEQLANDSGILIERSCPHLIAEKVNDLYNSPEKSEIIRKNAKERIRRKYTWSNYALNVHQLYQNIITE